MTEGRIGLRLKVLAGLVALMFVALTTRLWFLQVLAAEQFRSRANQNAVRLVEEDATRGRILDRDGDVLVGNRPSIVVLIDRQQLGDRQEAVLLGLSDLLDVEVETLVERMEDPRYLPYAPIPVAFDAREKAAVWIAEHPDDFPGVTTQEVAVRTYPSGSVAAHILGYTGPISGEELEDERFADYGQNDQIGKAGVERTYERFLRGQKGLHKILVDSAGRSLREIGSRAPVPGNDLVLSIDADVQALAEESLRLGMQLARGIYDENTQRNYEADGGAVVVMDPDTGQLLAMASAPTFDPRIFTDGLTRRELERLEAPAANVPQLNRAIAGQYPPASTFKSFIALSAFRDGVATMGSYGYNCPSEYVAPGDESGTVFRNWSSANLGYMNVARALEISCDTVFYRFGWDYWVRYFNTPGISRPLQKNLGSLGFGQPTNVDLPGELTGRIADPEWKAAVHEENPDAFPEGRWLPGDFILMSIGQGDTLVTPLQLARAYSVIANGGRLCKPQVAFGVRRPSDGKLVRRFKPKCGQKVPFSRTQLDYVRQALAGVPAPGGTAAGAFAGFPLSQVPVAGKTGTAEVRPYQDYSWFAAMAPAGDPQYVVVAVVERGGHGSTTAAPIVRRILEGLFELPLSPLVSGGATD